MEKGGNQARRTCSGSTLRTSGETRADAAEPPQTKEECVAKTK